MCGKCQEEYNKYLELKQKYEAVKEQTDKCKEWANKTVSSFSEVIIDGKSVDDGAVSNCSHSLMVVASNLTSLIKQCDEKMIVIEKGCPGPDHYNPKNKKNRLVK